MWKSGLAGIVAILIGSSAVLADSGDAELNRGRVAKSDAVMSVSHMVRLKAVLKLTAAQEPLWIPVEQTFREIGQAQEADGVQGFKHRVAAIGLNAMALRRLASAAYPLIRSLNEEQKQNGLAFARSVGLSSVAAAF